MNKKVLYNENLLTSMIGSGDIEIFELNEENLKKLDFLDENGWPTKKLELLLKDIDSFSPIFFKDNPKFWDTIHSKFSIYNNFLKNGENNEK